MPKYDHLPLVRIVGELERKKRPGWGETPPRDSVAHADSLQAKVKAVIDSVGARPLVSEMSEPLVIQIRNRAPVDPLEWPRVDMQILATDPRNTVVLLANDRELGKFRSRIEKYREPPPEGQKAPSYASLIAPIEEFEERSAADKIGTVLASEGYTTPDHFDQHEQYIVDIELYRPSNDMVPVFCDRIEKIVGAANGQVSSTYYGSPTCILLRAIGNGAMVRAILAAPEVLSLDRPPQPDASPATALDLDIGDVGEVLPADETCSSIGIIDSGLTSEHPLLAGSIAGVFGVPNELGDADEWGHGTPVAGVAAFGDVRQRLESKPFGPKFRLASARVLGANGRFDDVLLTPDRMERAIRRLRTDFGCRVINLSLADPKRKASLKPSAWASVLDQLARELDLVIVVAAGNRRDLMVAHPDDVVEGYPAYLFEDDNRILEPATAANVVTVGSITHTNGLKDNDDVAIRPIAEAGQPSPFTRIGPSVAKIRKPDFVDYGGTVVFDGATGQLLFGNARAEAGVLTNSSYLQRLFAARCGTSYASPLVAHKAALLRERFPSASANLIRALLGIAADQPESARNSLAGHTDDEIACVLGLGVCDVENALDSDDSRVILTAQGELPSDKFAVFEVPVPKIFQTQAGWREIRVALAFDPVTRHTRADYLGHTMSFELFRGLDDKTVFDACRKWSEAEGKPPQLKGKYKCPLSPSIERRRHSTLQVASFRAHRDMSKYGERYHLAVKCEADWSPEPSQRFAVAVQIRHEAQIPLYARIRERLRVRV